MIAHLKGILFRTDLTHAVIDVNGVGYLVSCSSRTLSQMGNVGDNVSIIIETHVREDAIQLFGFVDTLERDWFKMLTSVQGVGARICLAILSIMNPNDLFLAISGQDKTPLTQADGVGPKLAGRIVNELKDKVGGFGISTGAKPILVNTQKLEGSAQDAISALVNLGYKRQEVFSIVMGHYQQADVKPSVQELIRLGLQELGAR